MLKRTLVASLLLILSAAAQSDAADKDYLQRGDPQITSDYEIRYDRAVRRILSRGWRRDVVVRMFNPKPWDPERIAGISRQADGDRAFSVVTSHQLSRALDPAWGPEQMVPLRS